MTEYTYQEEQYIDVIEELKPLLAEHYKEVAVYQETIELNPNYHVYELMAAQGSLHMFTTRTVDKELIGYSVSFLNQHPHYSDHTYAVNDILYVHPDHRHTEAAPRMLTELEAVMREKGISVMTFHMKTYKPFETLMDALEYDKIEYLFSKLLKD